jgi:hypothetical protein
VDQLAFAEGNSNLTALRPPSPSPPAVAALPPAATAKAPPRVAGHSSPSGAVSPGVVGGALVVLVVLAVVALAGWRRIIHR